MMFPRLPPIVALLVLVAHSVVPAAPVDPADSDLQYIGRWDRSNASQPWAQAKGSTIVAGFTGTSLTVTMNTSSGEYFRVVVNGDSVGSSRLLLPSGVPVPIASGLTPGTHQVELIKETDVGRATLTGLDIDNGAALVPPPSRPDREIVFYGDSNLAGYSLESERNLGGSDLAGCHYTYAGITARRFDADYQNISRSGATISTLNSSFDRVDWTSNSPGWDFSSDATDLVVVNIGANDYFRPESQNKSRYHALLDDLRTAHPSAHIMLFNAYGWVGTEPANYTHEVIAERGDPNMSSAVFPWVFEQFHGCETDHAGMAQTLASHVETVMGWQAGAQDVVSGFGIGGDVANGNFEVAAPFGGWGWRYFDDPGVSRPFDPAGALSGDHYLRLVDGASSHQTNPASDGDVINARMWMRASTAGATVDVSIGFRDQEGGGETNSPMQQTTETFALTAEWEPYTTSATAPTDQNPVYSARLTFVAGAGDTVEIDVVSINEPDEVVNVRWADRQTMVWDGQTSASSYHLYGGLLSELSCSFFGSCWDDRDPDLVDLSLTEAADPPPGDGWFYLVTSEGPTGIESSPGESACGVRFHAPACP